MVPIDQNMFLGFLVVIFIRESVSRSLTEYTGTYVWGNEGSEVPLPLAIGEAPNLSFIELLYNGDMVLIDLVQRGTDWKEGDSFCSLMLPAVVRDFISSISVNITQVGAIVAVNTAARVKQACRCYTGTMMEFGFTEINGNTLENQFEKIAFCNRDENRAGGSLVGSKSHDVLVTLGQSTAIQTDILDRALLRIITEPARYRSHRD